MIAITTQQTEALVFHSAQIRMLNAAIPHIADQKVRVYVGPKSAEPTRTDPLGQGLALDIDVLAPAIRDRVDWLLGKHHAALRELGFQLVPE